MKQTSSQPLNVAKGETQRGKKNLLSQIFRILHALYKLRKKRARKTSVVQATLGVSKVTFHTITSSISLGHEL